MRAILDPNVLIAAVLSPRGAPARVVHAWRQGAFECLVTPVLEAELERAFQYPKLRKRIDPEDAAAFSAWLQRTATDVEDPTQPPPLRSRDPGDDYLLAVAARERAALVTGDQHLLEHRREVPVFSAASFLRFLESSEPE